MNSIRRTKGLRNQAYVLYASIMVAMIDYAQAGWLDSGKRIILDATEPIGIGIIVIGGMKISAKDLYGGLAAVVGGIFVFKAQDIVSGLK